MTPFVDAFGLIAWLNPRDEFHAAVTAYLDGFAGRLVTTEWVLMEVADALSAPEARSTVGRIHTKSFGERLTLRGFAGWRVLPHLGG